MPKPLSEENTEPVKPVVSQAPEPVKPPETPTIEKEPEPPVKPVSVTKPVPEEKKETQPDDSEPDSKKEKSKPNIKKNLIAFGICVVIAIVIALIITNFVASHTKVEGNSMESTLENGDDIIVEKFSYLTNNPERYDIIVFRESESVNYIKRVIALPGETIQITEGKMNGPYLMPMEMPKWKMVESPKSQLNLVKMNILSWVITAMPAKTVVTKPLVSSNATRSSEKHGCGFFPLTTLEN